MSAMSALERLRISQLFHFSISMLIDDVPSISVVPIARFLVSEPGHDSTKASWIRFFA